MAALPDHPNIALAVRYHHAVADGATGESLAAFFHPHAVQRERPNPFAPRGAVRDVAAILDAAERGRKVMSAQRFDIYNAVAAGDQVALELTWTGTLAQPLGLMQAGEQLRAEIATFLTIREGVIVEQRNYDCHHPHNR